MSSETTSSSTLSGHPLRRAAILLAVVLGSLSLAFILPKQPTARPAAIKMELPELLTFWTPSARYGGEREFQAWKGEPLPVSQAELTLLADDTKFEKKSYVNIETGSDRPQIHAFHAAQASIVMSGHDLNDSIHRPERCLPSQGYKGLQISRKTLRTASGDIPISRIRCYHEQLDPETGKFRVGPDGQPVRVEQLFYYWFVGNHALSANHYERTFIDMKDRLVGGYDQHWAYVLLGATFTEPLVTTGVLRGDHTYPRGRSEAQTDALLEQLTQAIAKEAILWPQLDEAPKGE